MYVQPSPPPAAPSRSSSTTNLHLLTKHHVTMTTDVLGNAYLAVFFATKHATSDLEAAMKAYKQAVRESVRAWGQAALHQPHAQL